MIMMKQWRTIPTSFPCFVRSRSIIIVNLPATTKTVGTIAGRDNSRRNHNNSSTNPKRRQLQSSQQLLFRIRNEDHPVHSSHNYRTFYPGRRPHNFGSACQLKALAAVSCISNRSMTTDASTIATATATHTIDETILEDTPKQMGPKDKLYEIKPWLDNRRPLDVRINELLEAETLHPEDIIHPMMKDLIKQCCRPIHSGSAIEGMQRGQEVLDRCLVEKRRYQATDFKLFLPQKLYEILIFGWGKIAHKEFVAQARMKEILQSAIEEGKMDDAFLHSKLNIPRTKRIASEVYPTVYLFNAYLIGLGNAAKITPQAALDGEALLFDMIEYNRTLGWHTKPNTRSYTHVITAYANTKHVAAGRRAYNMLQQMKAVHDAEKDVYEKTYQQAYNYNNPKENKHQIITLDAVAYTATLKALQISNRSQELVMDILNEAVNAPGVVLDAALFVVTIKSLSNIIDHENNALRRIELAQEAESLLRTMIQYSTEKGFQKTISPTTSVSGMDDAFENELEDSGIPLFDNDDDGDDAFTASSVRHPTTNADGDKSEGLPSSTNESTSDTENESQQLDTSLSTQQPLISEEENRKSLQIGYNACIHAWAQSFCREGAPQCELLLQEMLDSPNVQPNTITFNTCLYAWTKSHKYHADAGKRAIELLYRQIELSAADQIGNEVKPDFQSFTSCILVQSKSAEEDRLQNALSLLNTLLEEIKLGNMTVKGNPTGPFSAVLTTIANYKVPTTTGHVAEEENIEAGSSEIDVFNSAIDTQSDPYSLAINIFDQIERDVHGIGTTVDHHCVTAFLKCILAHGVSGSTERENTSRRVFHDTCQSGHVSRQVLKEFQNILGPAANTFPNLRNPPKFWSRNVPLTFR